MRSEFNSYQVYYYSKQPGRRLILLYKDGKNVGVINLNENLTSFDGWVDSNGRVQLLMRSSDYSEVVDLLRNESPLYIFVNEAIYLLLNRSTALGHI